MTRFILAAACAVAALGLAACGYDEQDYNAANADYNAAEANYAGNEAEYTNAADYNEANTAYAANEVANNAANASDNEVANNTY